MKKIFLLLILLCVVLTIPLSTLHAQEPTPVVDYKLPYPGMLPDNSLYKLKVLRDKIMLLLIKDTDKKAQYYLLLANKQFLMSKMLVDKGKILLARETALKAENQITLMTMAFKFANQVPKTIFLNEVKLATLKHQELLKEIIAKVSADDAAIFSTVLEFSQRNADELESLTAETE